MKRVTGLIIIMVFILLAAGCSQPTVSGEAVPSTLDQVLKKKKIVIGTAPGYLPFEMKNKEGEFIGYDIDLGKAIGEALQVDVEFKQFKFSGLIPALQTGEIDLVIAGMTIRGDRALAVSFSNPYYATGQVLMVPTSDKETTSWQDLDVKGKQIAVSQGTTGALLAKQLYKNAKVLDFDTFSDASMALVQGKVDALVYDEPAIRIYETMQKESVKGIYDLISTENLGIAVRHNDLMTVQWLNSFLDAYKDSPADLASKEKWFHSSDWMEKVEEKK